MPNYMNILFAVLEMHFVLKNWLSDCKLETTRGCNSQNFHDVIMVVFRFCFQKIPAFQE